MTIEQILECSADQLEAISDEELLKHFEKYLVVTRPELAQKEKQDNRRAIEPAMKLSPAKQQALQLLASQGVDLSFLNRRRKR